jgi:DNA polymerase III sliding clamp (beta) subunit (PCNA family)
MKINREEFLKVLALVRPGLSKKEIVEQSIHFIFDGENISTYNDYICISHPFKTDFKCSIKAEEFYKLLQSMKEDNIIIDCDKDMLVKINGKSSRAGLTAIKEGKIDEYIKELDTKNIKRWRVLPKDFIEGVFLCMFSVSKDMTSGTLSCLSIKDDNISSSDNLRISRYTMEDSIKNEVLIPLQSVIELVKYPVVKYCLVDSWIHFKTEEGIIFSSRIMKGDFPDIDNFFELKGTSIKLPKELQSALQMTKIVVENSIDVIDQKIEINISKELITCRGDGNTSWAEKDVPCIYKGKEIKFLVNPVFFTEILNKTVSVVIGEGKALFKSADNFKHIMVLPE